MGLGGKAIDPNWASKISGFGQKTGKDTWHADASYEKAVEFAKDPDVVSVHLNQSLNTALGTKGVSNQRPDITVTYKDGRVHVCECVSPSQSVGSQQDKIDAMTKKADQVKSGETIERGGSNDPTDGKATGSAPTKGGSSDSVGGYSYRGLF